MNWRRPKSARGERLLVISNRGPYTLRRRGRSTELVRAVGGLSTTLDDTLRRRGGVWLAWSGTYALARKRRGSRRSVTIPIQSVTTPGAGYRLRLLNLTEQQIADYYHGFSNRSLWPLCHYFITRSRFRPDDWHTYESVNRLFARAASQFLTARGIVWVHDYHLALVPGMLRTLRPAARIATFWHIPFPSDSVFRVNPWAREVVTGLLGSDLIGFHTAEYARHFLGCAERLAGATIDRSRFEARFHGRTVRVGSFPIGVEARTLARYGSDPSVLSAARRLRESIATERLILGVDRLDYTKGILERLLAYERFLASNPKFHRRVCFLQIQVPSRETVPEYRRLREEIDRTVGRILGRFSSAGWTPLRYLCRGFSRKDLVAYYRAADLMLVTPLRDGMNLVAQEYVATRTDDDGVLVLSEFAGAAERLCEAIFVNPYDPTRIAEAIELGLTMKASERHTAMSAMRERVLTEDVEWWVSWFLAAAATCGKLKAVPARKARSA